MHDETITKLEFIKVLAHICRYCSTARGKQYVESIRPFSGACQLSEGTLVTRAKEILIQSAPPPLEPLPHLEEALRLSKIGDAMLPASKILQILQLSVCSRMMVLFLKNHGEIAPELAVYASKLFSDKVFEHHITRVLDENGGVRDSASRELQRIRSEIKEKNFQLRKLVGKISKDLAEQDLLREDYLTLRDGRFVLPIRVEHKRQIRGFIHSESATGQTVYIEPEETLHLNNEIVTLTFAERREIDRLLKELTKIIGGISQELLQSHETLGFLDSVFARAQHSIEILGAFPEMQQRDLRILDARHPLLLSKLGRERTVPLNIELTSNRVVVVTGPNAGGKTVVLKTVGLLTLMVYSGIHIPASPDSVFPEFDSIFVDIGDQQSIEDDLSTFSSHLSNIKNILSESNNKSLVLLDELGTGTDPVAGAALGIATLLRLRDTGALVLSTTHHGVLKTLAGSHDGFENAAMQFDSVHLKPTYHFRMGIPGSSYAFEIASRLGFESEFLKLAESYVDSDTQSIEKALLMIEKKEQELKEKLRKYEIENSRLKGLTAMYQKKTLQLDEEKRTLGRTAEEKMKAFLAEANKEIEKLIKDIKETAASKESVKKIKDFLIHKGKAIHTVPDDPKIRRKADAFGIGQKVKIKSTQSAGEIKAVDEIKKNARITVGTLTMLVPFSDLETHDSDVKTSAPSLSGNYINREYGYRIDIRGKRTDEVRFQIIKFLDEAYSSGADRVEILHGKGEGVLKKTVKEILDEHIGVKNSYFAPLQAGGEGVTIVEFS